MPGFRVHPCGCGHAVEDGVIPLRCPRCGELVRMAAPEKRPAPEKRERIVPPQRRRQPRP